MLTLDLLDNMPYADSVAPKQLVRMCRMTWSFTVRSWHETCRPGNDNDFRRSTNSIDRDQSLCFITCPRMIYATCCLICISVKRSSTIKHFKGEINFMSRLTYPINNFKITWNSRWTIESRFVRRVRAWSKIRNWEYISEDKRWSYVNAHFNYCPAG